MLVLDPTAFAAHVARNRALDAPVGSLVLDDIAAHIKRMSDRFVAEDLIFLRSTARAVVSGVKCVWVARGDNGAYEPLSGMSDAEIDARVGGGL